MFVVHIVCGGEGNLGMVDHKISFDIIGTNLANNQEGEFAGGD